LPAAELIGFLRFLLLRDAHLRKKGSPPGFPLLLVQAPLHNQRFTYYFKSGKSWIQRARRILEYQLNLRAYLAHCFSPRAAISFPPNTILPDVGRSKQAMQNASVLFPEPDSPTRARVDLAQWKKTPLAEPTLPSWTEHSRSFVAFRELFDDQESVHLLALAGIIHRT